MLTLEEDQTQEHGHDVQDGGHGHTYTDRNREPVQDGDGYGYYTNLGTVLHTGEHTSTSKSNIQVSTTFQFL